MWNGCRSSAWRRRTGGRESADREGNRFSSSLHAHVCHSPHSFLYLYQARRTLGGARRGLRGMHGHLSLATLWCRRTAGRVDDRRCRLTQCVHPPQLRAPPAAPLLPPLQRSASLTATSSFFALDRSSLPPCRLRPALTRSPHLVQKSLRSRACSSPVCSMHRLASSSASNPSPMRISRMALEAKLARQHCGPPCTSAFPDCEAASPDRGRLSRLFPSSTRPSLLPRALRFC